MHFRKIPSEGSVEDKTREEEDQKETIGEIKKKLRSESK